MAVDNLRVQKQINEAIFARGKLLESETAELSKQLKLAIALNEAIGGAKFDRSTIDRLNELVDAIREGTDKAEELERAIDEAAERAETGLGDAGGAAADMNDKLGKATKSFPVMGAAAIGALDGIIDGFKFSANLVSSLLDLVKSVTVGIWNIGKAIISIPFKMLDALVEMALAGGGGMELMQAYENVRKEFGSFREATSRDVIKSFRNMRGELANTGLSVFRIFGFIHEQLEFVTELAKEMGASFSVLGPHIAENVEPILAFQKGLGLANEDMRAFGSYAIAMATPINELQRTVANYSLQLGSAFGLSQKLVAKDIAKMVKDVQRFGGITIKEMGKAATYFRNLGVEIDKVVGVIDKYDNFESAAEGAAELAQAFGMNVDAFQMFSAENPAERIEMLRKSLFLAGKSADNMGRRSLKVLAQASGDLDVETARLVFSMKNAGKSYEEIAKGADKAEKKQLSQAEALVKLADSIERMIKEGQLQAGGFFKQFIDGFVRGMKWSRPFMVSLWTIRRALFSVHWAGIQLGRVFVTTFPGVTSVLQGFADVAVKINKLIKGIGKEAEIAFNALKAGKPASEVFSIMLSNIKILAEKAVPDILSGFAPGGKVYEGFMKIGAVVVKAIGGILPWAMKELANVIRNATEFMRDPKKFLEVMGAKVGKGSASAEAFVEALRGAWEAIKGAWPELKKALGDLWDVAWSKIKPVLKKHAPKIAATLAAILFGPAVIGGAIQGALAGFGTMFGGMLTKKLMTGGARAAVSAGGRRVLPSVLGKFLGPAAIAFVFGEAALGVSRGTEKFADSIEKEMGPGSRAEARVGAGAAGLVDQLLFGLVPDDLTQKMGLSTAQLFKSFLESVEKDFGTDAKNTIKEYIVSHFDLLGAFGEAIDGIITKDEKKIEQGFKKLPGAIANAMWKPVKLGITQVAPRIAGGLAELSLGVASGITNAFGGMTKGMGTLAEETLPGAGLGFKVMGAGMQDASFAMDFLKSETSNLTDLLTGKKSIKEAAKESSKSWNKFRNDITGVWIDLKESASKSGKDMKRFADDFKEHVHEPLVKKFSEFADAASKSFGDAKESMSKSMKEAWDKIKEVWSKMSEWVKTNVVDPIVKHFVDIKDNVGKFFSELWTTLVAGVENGKKQLGVAFKSLAVAILKPLLQFVKPVMSALGPQLAIGFTMLEHNITQFERDILEQKSPSRRFARMGESMAKGLEIGMSKLPRVVEDNLGVMNNPIRDLVKESEALGKSLEAHRARAIGLRSKLPEMVEDNLGVVNGPIRDLVKESEALGKSLEAHRARAIELRPKLRGLAGEMMANETATIKRMDHTIVINQKVVLEAGQLERVLLDRQGSQIASISKPLG